MNKVETFPTPQSDELLYSMLARHHMRCGGDNPKNTLEDLLGSRSASTTYDFPCRLNDLCDRLPNALEFTPELIIEKHTLLPFYASFLPSSRVTDISSRMSRSDSGGSIHTMVGNICQGRTILKNLRYCPECVKEEQASIGEAYWHRSHQLPDIHLCHEHHVPLLESNARVNSRMNKHTLYALEAMCQPDTIVCSSLQKITSLDTWLAEKAHWLLANRALLIELDVLKESYLSLLLEQGYASPFGKIKKDKLLTDFELFYSPQILAKYSSELKTKSYCCWLLTMIRNVNKGASPLRHLLLMKFLGVEPEDLLQGIYKGSPPFGKGPYLCLNTACNNFRKAVIKDIIITRHTNTGAPVGNFECGCGFAYARTGPDKTEEDKFKRTRIIKVGSVWEKEFKRLESDPNTGLLETARSLGVTANTIYRYRDEFANKEMVVEVETDNKEAKKDEYKKNVLRVMEANPELGRTAMRPLFKSEYAWLYRHDRDWLFDVLPQTKKHVPEDYQVDWEARDNEWYELVKVIIDEMLAETDNMKRVTLGRIGETLGQMTTLRNSLAKLPKTKKLIEENLETVDDFQIRRVKIAVQGMLEKGLDLKKWKIVQAARLRPNYSPEVAHEIAQHINQQG